MVLKNNPISLFNSALQTVSESLLHQWKQTYLTNYVTYVELRNSIGSLIPDTVYNQIFDKMVDLHARAIQHGKDSTNLTISSLIGSIISPKQQKLCLNGLRHMGLVLEYLEIIHLENIILKELPTLSRLQEISLQTSGTYSTLPTCNDNILNEIGKWCPNLTNLDISNNHTITDVGLTYLLPSETRRGCVSLVKLLLFECSVTAEGVANLFGGLLKLKFLGYRETGQSLLHFSRNNSDATINKLRLAHINNLGVISRTCKDVWKLNCRDDLVNAISTFCPNINGLKVRISDSGINLLTQIKTITILELVYNLGTLTSPGSGTVQYLNVCGTQFVSLFFICDTFTTKYLKVVCEQCNNLKYLWIRCNSYHCDQDITSSDKRKCTLFSLETFGFKVGWPGFDPSLIPRTVMYYVLHKTSVLRKVVLAMNNSLLCDDFVEYLFSSIKTVKLQEIEISPCNKSAIFLINLTMVSVETLIAMCPVLERLGNLFLWDIRQEEIQELRRNLKFTNSALVLINKL